MVGVDVRDDLGHPLRAQPLHHRRGRFLRIPAPLIRRRHDPGHLRGETAVLGGDGHLNRSDNVVVLAAHHPVQPTLRAVGRPTDRLAAVPLGELGLRCGCAADERVQPEVVEQLGHLDCMLDLQRLERYAGTAEDRGLGEVLEQGHQGSLRSLLIPPRAVPRSRIVTSVMRSCLARTSLSVRAPRRTSSRSSCRAWDRIELGATS